MFLLKKSSFFFKGVLFQQKIVKKSFLAFFDFFFNFQYFFFYNFTKLHKCFFYFLTSSFINFFFNKIIIFFFFKPSIYLFQSFVLSDFISFLALKDFPMFLVGFSFDFVFLNNCYFFKIEDLFSVNLIKFFSFLL
jgi:hypothetical protein